MYWQAQIKTPRPEDYLGSHSCGFPVIPIDKPIYNKYLYKIRLNWEDYSCAKEFYANFKPVLNQFMVDSQITPKQIILRATNKKNCYLYLTSKEHFESFLISHSDRVKKLYGPTDEKHAKLLSDRFTYLEYRSKPYYSKYNMKVEFAPNIFRNAGDRFSYEDATNLLDWMKDQFEECKHETSGMLSYPLITMYVKESEWLDVEPFLALRIGSNVKTIKTYIIEDSTE